LRGGGGADALDQCAQLVRVLPPHRMREVERVIPRRAELHGLRSDDALERLGDQHSRRCSLQLDLDRVVQTARRTSASVAKTGDHHVRPRGELYRFVVADRVGGARLREQLDLDLSIEAHPKVGGQKFANGLPFATSPITIRSGSSARSAGRNGLGTGVGRSGRRTTIFAISPPSPTERCSRRDRSRAALRRRDAHGASRRGHVAREPSSVSTPTSPRLRSRR
jgi:hypothetical protein